MKLVGLSGSPTAVSKTLIAVQYALSFAAEIDPALEVQLINIRDFDVIFCDGRDPSLYEGDTRIIIEAVAQADAMIVGTPMYRGSYTGRLKNVFDILPNGCLRGTPVGLIATGGSDHHYLALEHELRPLLTFFGAHVLPGSVYATNTHYSDADLVDEGTVERLRQLARSCVQLARCLDDERALGADPPEIKREFLSQSGRADLTPKRSI
jgi:MsuE subfamily FMN reductase